MTGNLRILPPQRPRTRGDCEDGLRPCPWITCQFHLERRTGDTCALDVADRGPVTLDEISRIFGITRAAIGMIETKAIAKIQQRHRRHRLDLADHLPEGNEVHRADELQADSDEHMREDAGGAGQPAVSEEEQAERDFTDRAWRAYDRESRELAAGTLRTDFPPLVRSDGEAPPLEDVGLDPQPRAAPELELDLPAPADEPITEEKTMDTESCIASAKELIAEHGRTSFGEVAAHFDVTVHQVRRALVPLVGSTFEVRGGNGGGIFLRGTAPPPKAQKKPSPRQKNPSAPPRPQPKALRPAPPRSDDPIVDQLRARRTELLAQVDRLNTAIDALEAG